MATFAIKVPRRIAPELIELGDDIMVEYPKSRGLITSNRGIVAKIVESGELRFLCTSEGATICNYHPGGKNTIKVTLYGREESPQATLFDNMEVLKERIAS